MSEEAESCSEKLLSSVVSSLCSSQNEFRESGHCSQDSMREDSFVSSTGPDQFSETAIFSGSDSETHGPPTPSQDQPPNSVLPDSDPPPPSEETTLTTPPPSDHVNDSSSEVCISAPSELHLDTDMVPTVSEPEEKVQTTGTEENTPPVQEEKEAETTEKNTKEPSVHQPPRRSTSILSRKLSSDSLSVSVFTDTWLSVENNTHTHTHTSKTTSSCDCI